MEKYFFLKLRLIGAKCLLPPRRGEAKDPRLAEQTARLGCPGTRSVPHNQLLSCLALLHTSAPSSSSSSSGLCSYKAQEEAPWELLTLMSHCLQLHKVTLEPAGQVFLNSTQSTQSSCHLRMLHLPRKGRWNLTNNCNALSSNQL